MDTLTYYFNTILPYISHEFIVLLLSIGFAITVVSVLSLSRTITRTTTTSRTSRTTEAQVTEHSQALHKHIHELEQRIEHITHHCEQISRQLPRTALIRYNPFRDSGVGGNQSFSLATIDQDGNGSIITHLFSREMSRVQAKEIQGWQSETELSPEEQSVLQQIKNTH